MPNQLSALVEQKIVAFALGHPGLGPRRIASRLARPQWGGLIVSPNGVYKTLVRHGLNTRAKRLALVAGYRAPFAPPRAPAPAPHIDSTGRASWSASTASSSGACTAPRARSGRSRRSTLTAVRLGRAGHHPDRAPRRRRVRPPRVREQAARRRRAHPDPLRAPADQRPRRAPAPHDPRGVLAPGVRALSPGPLRRPAPRPRPLPARLQLRPRTPRTNHAPDAAQPTSSTVPANGAEMSRTRRHNSESVQPRPARAAPPRARRSSAPGGRASPSR